MTQAHVCPHGRSTPAAQPLAAGAQQSTRPPHPRISLGAKATEEMKGQSPALTNHRCLMGQARSLSTDAFLIFTLLVCIIF